MLINISRIKKLEDGSNRLLMLNPLQNPTKYRLWRMLLVLALLLGGGSIIMPPLTQAQEGSSDTYLPVFNRHVDDQSDRETVDVPVLSTAFTSGTQVRVQAAIPASPNAIVVQCNGNTGDTNAIQTAINDSHEGEEIILSGRCVIDQTIKLLGNRSYRGESRTGTVVVKDSDVDIVALMASDSFMDDSAYTGQPISIRQLTLQGDEQGDTAGLILRSWLTTVEDVYITGMGSDGIRLSNPSHNGPALSNTSVNGRISASFIENSGRHGIYVEDDGNSLTDWIISDSWIAESGKDGIHLENAAGWMVERNHIYGVGENAIYANRLFGTTISNNYIEGFGESDASPLYGVWYGILGTAQGGNVGSTIFGNRVFNVLHGESNNDVEYHYIAVSVNYGTANVSVTGNTIVGVGTFSSKGLVYFAKSETRLNVASTGNIVEQVGTARSEGSRVDVSAGQ